MELVDSDSSEVARVKIYASEFNLDVGEAQRRLALEPAIASLANTVSQNYADTSSGLWVTHEPDFIVHIGVVPPLNSLPDLVVPISLTSTVKYEPARYSANQLAAALAATSASFRSEDVDADLEVSIPENEVQATVPAQQIAEAETLLPRAEAEGVLSQVGSKAHRGLDGVNSSATADHNAEAPVRIVQGPVSRPAASFYGGLKITGSGSCTSGFTVERDGDGRRGIATAGHCPNALKIDSSGTALSFAGEYFSGSGDAQWYTASSAVTFQRWVYDGQQDSSTPYYQVIGTTAPDGLQYVGQVVCKYGITTFFTCGKIRSVNAAPGYVKDAEPTFVTVTKTDRTAMALPGDSGGPVFVGETAYGIVSGYSPTSGSARGKTMIYMKVKYLAKLGVHVVGRAG